MKRKVTFILILAICSFLCCSCNKYEDYLSINIIDVGQGDSILISTPNKKNILIDSGDENNEKIVKSYLKMKNIKDIDLIIASHLDKDHIGSLDYVVDTFNVKKIYTPNQKDDSTHYTNLIKSLNNKNLKVNFLNKDDNLSVDEDISIKVLNPSYISNNNNSNSIVFNLTYKDMDFLFTGDCDEKNEIDMINYYNLDNIEFLKVSHHGSSSSSSDMFIKEVSPDIAVISCGYKNQYGHPHQSTLDTLDKYNVKTYRTDINGDLVFYSDGVKIFTTKKYK